MCKFEYSFLFEILFVNVCVCVYVCVCARARAHACIFECVNTATSERRTLKWLQLVSLNSCCVNNDGQRHTTCAHVRAHTQVYKSMCTHRYSYLAAQENALFGNNPSVQPTDYKRALRHIQLAIDPGLRIAHRHTRRQTNQYALYFFRCVYTLRIYIYCISSHLAMQQYAPAE